MRIIWIGNVLLLRIEYRTFGVVNFETVKAAFEDQELFRDKTWRLSPSAFGITQSQYATILGIGESCVAFQLALERLYRRAVGGRRLLRNGDLDAGWVVEYLDAGKPEGLIEHQREAFQEGRLARVMRPDLLVTESGFSLTELDSVPGGIGLTGFLNRLYETDGPVVGSGDRMLRAFDAAMGAETPEHHNPFVAILVSDEAETYRPEMEWLASELQRIGRRVFVFDPEDLMPLGESVCVDIDGSPQRVDVIYRFFELFDLPHLAPAKFLLDSVEEGHVDLTPPMRPILEEKLALALFHHPRLEPYWREQLGKTHYRRLERLIPRSWVVDPSPLGPNGFLHAPSIGGRQPAAWSDLANGTQKERNLILKMSGFSERAWGARSVTLGSDVSREEWGRALVEAIGSWPETPFILQDYHKPIRCHHPLFEEDGTIRELDARVRLCPYFFLTDEGVAGEDRYGIELAGILATLCPADKKIIHGMKDAALLPVRVVG